MESTLPIPRALQDYNGIGEQDSAPAAIIAGPRHTRSGATLHRVDGGDEGAEPNDEVAPPAAAAPYPVTSTVEARWRGGAKHYTALVVATGPGTVDLKYTDGDEEKGVRVDLVRPLERRRGRLTPSRDRRSRGRRP